MQDINLLPQTEVVEQTRTKAVNFSTIIAIIFLLGFVGVTGYVLYLQNIDKTTIADLDAKIKTSRDQIMTKSEIEVKVRNLDKKYTAIKNIFSNQKKYSMLMEELRIRQPFTIDLNNIDVKEGKLNINGSALDYVSIQEFVNNLTSDTFKEPTEGLEKLFTAVSINSVNMESTKSSIQFFIVVDFDPALLK